MRNATSNWVVENVPNNPSTFATSLPIFKYSNYKHRKERKDYGFDI